jgi:hypothetical protein
MTQRSHPAGVLVGFHQACGGALFQRLSQILPCVVGRAGPSQERIARLHQAAVGAQLAGGMRAQPLGGFRSVVQRVHQNDSSTDWVKICGLTAMSGCTPSRRKVC